MRNPTFDEQHLTEYFLFGSLAAILYAVPLEFFLYSDQYNNFYYLYIGVGLFMCAIFFHTYRLIDRPYDKSRAVSMMISGLLTTITGVILASIIAFVSVFIFFPDLFSSHPVINMVQGAPATGQPKYPFDLLFMILGVTIIMNMLVGAFVAVMTSYATKRDQTQDKPAVI
jgi:heme/copper-type cytochrome/quinol oxidase subunit 2